MATARRSVERPVNRPRSEATAVLEAVRCLLFSADRGANRTRHTARTRTRSPQAPSAASCILVQHEQGRDAPLALPTMLPTSLREKSKRAPPAQLYLRFMARRYLVFAVVGFALLTLASRVYWPHDGRHPPNGMSANPLAQHPPLPPLYEAYHEAELRLPQHRWGQSRPRKEEKFLFVAGHSRSTLLPLYRCGSDHTDYPFSHRLRMGKRHAGAAFERVHGVQIREIVCTAPCSFVRMRTHTRLAGSCFQTTPGILTARNTRTTTGRRSRH